MARMNEELMALADVYAASLLNVARQQDQQDQVAEAFADLIAYMDEHPDFANFLTSANIDDESRRESLEKLFRGRMNDLLLNLLQVLNNRGRVDLLRVVHRALVLRLEEAHHQHEVLVRTATPLTDDLRTQVRTVLGRRMDKEAILIEQVEPALIGGMIVHIGDYRFDASLATMIRAVRARLADRASREVHESNGRYVTE